MASAARPLPQAMKLTDAAAERVREIMAKAEKPVVGLRIGVKNGGCAGMEYTMEWAEDQKPFDEVVEDKGVKVLIDAFLETNRGTVAKDLDGAPVYLAKNSWDVGYVSEKNPAIRFTKTKERA